MKKKLAWVLVLCLMLQMLPGTALPALAEETDMIIMDDWSGMEGNKDEPEGITGYDADKQEDDGKASGEENTGSAVKEDAGVPEENTGSAAKEDAGVPEENTGSAVKEDAGVPEENTGSVVKEDAGIREESIDGIIGQDAGTQEKTDGILEVRIVSALPIQALSNVKVSVSGENDYSRTESLSVGGEGISSETARFEQMPAGEYTVVVSAGKFADYTQKVEVQKDRIARIQVYSAQVHTGSDAHPGWIMLGDVNGDKTINDQDKQKVLDNLHAGGYEAAADLNSNQAVDLMDLQYLVQSLGEHQLSTVESLLNSVPAAAVGTHVEGDLDNLIKDGGTVTIRSAAGGEISEANPVGLEFTLAGEEEEAPVMEGITIQAPVEQENGDVVNNIAEGNITLTYVREDGSEGEYEIPIATENTGGEGMPKQSGAAAGSGAKASAKENIASVTARNSRAKAAVNVLRASDLGGAKVTVDENGSLNINFGTQIAVKRVSIRITGTTKKNSSLMEIAKVEFVNDMASRIPAPELDVPEIRSVDAANEALTVSWSRETNVTGYEVSISGPVKDQENVEEQIVRVADTTHRIASINGKKLKNYGEYTIKVRSVNGDWTSPWSDPVTGIPAPQSLPAPPDNVTAEGGHATITVKWKAMDDANGYMVYYRKKGEGQFQPAVDGFVENNDGADRIEKTSCTIVGLATNTEYEIYVKSWNELGWGQPSLTVTASTMESVPPVLPAYHLINNSNGPGKLTAHIKDATIGGVYGAKMVGSPLDEGKNKGGLGLVDDNYESYWILENWDDGAYNTGSLANGMTVTLDQEYEMSYFTFGAVDQKTGMNLVKVRYWNDTHGSEEQSVRAQLLEKRDANNNKYYIVRFSHPITANRIHMRLGRDWWDMSAMKVGEIHFHQYDDLERDINDIYADETHTTLKEAVKEETIADLEKRLEESDAATGEKHPLYSELKLDLQTARALLNNTLSPVYKVHPEITAKKDAHLGFTGLNAWQPLGKTAYAGESVQVIVGHPTKQNGERAELQLVVTQQHAESASVSKTVNLTVGKNEITIPQLTSNNFEKGGQLYIVYTGNNDADNYAVRVNGGSDIPVLDLYKKTGQERTDAIKKYVEDLEEYQSEISEKHNERHKAGTSSSVAYTYDEQNCILNATDIMMDEMMYSLPATQVWNSIKGTTTEEKAKALDTALQAMENTMTLFYQHKGLSNEAVKEKGNNALPSQHLNIRYMRMFAGAFMYAAGNHIGVQWKSATLTGAKSWDEFGWGIAHEIGHNINQNSYAIAEITNNYFAQLLTKDIDGTRFQYEDVYKKVTSGAVGRASSEAVQLALYWQLHLAYDDNTNDRAIYDDYNDQWNNLFFARVDTYARNPGKAPKGTLTLGNDADQNLMRLACAAAEKNLLPFFERWGMTPDETTKAYAALYGEAEEKALYYVNDDARDYRVNHQSEEDELSLAGQNVADAEVSATDNRATVTINPKAGVNTDAILGYEIIRTMTSNGQKESCPVGFVEANDDGTASFVDTVSTINNRVMQYEVKAVDKFLNYAAGASAGSVKIETDGLLAKDGWTVKTNMVSEADVEIEHSDDDPDSGYYSDPSKAEHEKVQSIVRIIDNNVSGEDAVYTGKKDADTPQITIDMHKLEEVTALKYMGSDIAKLTVEVSGDGQSWTTVKETEVAASNDSAAGGSVAESSTEAYTTIWFDAVEESERTSWIGTYDARYIRLTMPETENVTINEIGICGPSGDNLEFMTTGDGKPAVGVLAEDYTYGDGEKDVIPEGSLVFTGTYKGNPAYNVVMLYDEEGNIIGASDGDEEAGIEPSVEAEQVIFADVPEHGNLGEVSNGTWVYYVEPGKWKEEDVKGLTVRGELYRVDNALTLEGERVVSDTLPLTVPQDLPSITFTEER